MTEINTAALLLVYRPLLAYLLARDATLTGRPLDDLHQGFVSDISDIVQRLNGGTAGDQVEAVVHAELDRLFAMAKNIGHRRLGPGDSAGS